MNTKQKKIYLDYGATTPLAPEALKKMLPYLKKEFGNPASIHSFGQRAMHALEKSREVVANLIGANTGEIIFTGSATESNNLALKGIAFTNREKGNHVIISQIEHHCVLESAKWLESQGFEITKLRVDKYGMVDIEELKNKIKKNTILVSIMHANNEIGTIQPIEKIGKICREREIYFHTDAAQSFGKVPIDVNKMNIDLLTASSHKMYGPKGAACLFIKKGVKIKPILHGGGQEEGLRSGTVNVAAVVGFAEAVRICKKEIYPVKYPKGQFAEDELFNRVGKENQIIMNYSALRGGVSLQASSFNGFTVGRKLRDKLINGILKKIIGSKLNGSKEKRLFNNVNVFIPGAEGESMAIALDQEGVAVSTGSACSSSSLEPSHVLLALGLSREQVHCSLRMTLGRYTTEQEINKVLIILPRIVGKLRKLSGYKN